MTTLSFNTQPQNINAAMTISTEVAFNKRNNASTTFKSFAVIEKSLYRKSGTRYDALDWDTNKNELEFE